MLITTRLLYLFRQYIHGNSDLNYKLFLDAYANFSNKVLKSLDEYSLSVDSLDSI
jgi:hypothetical protein